MKRFFTYIIILGLLQGFTTLSASAADQPKRGGTLTMAISSKMKMMNPLVRTSSVEKRIRDLMFESLVALDLKGKVQPNLAESWEVSKDGKTYTFRLRKGVKFHNGQEMTAEDAKFAIDYTLNPRNGAYGIKDLSQVEGAKASDRYTLKIYLKNPTPVFPVLLSEIRSFSVIPKGSLEEGVRKPVTFPPGTGPFKFVEWKPGRRIVFDRFDDYWGQKAYVDRVILRVIGNSTVRFTALRTGDVDLIVRVPHEWVKTVEQGKVKGIGFAASFPGNANNIEFNVADPPFNNKKLRFAVAHAINRKEILEGAYFGMGVPARQRFPKGHYWYFDEAPIPSYDLAKARALVKESGYKGEEVDLMISRGATGYEAEATIIQAQLKKIGVKMKVTPLERASALDYRRKGKFHFKLSGGSAYADPVQAYNEYECEDLRKRRSNEAGYCDKEFDRLLAKAETELDPAKRRELFKQLVQMLNKEIPLLPILFATRHFAYRDYVKGFTTDQNAHYRYWGGGLNYTWIDK